MPPRKSARQAATAAAKAVTPTPTPPPAPANPLKGCRVAVSGSIAGVSQKDVLDKAKELGAAITNSVTKTVTHLISTAEDYADNSPKVVKAKGFGTTVVSYEWLEECAKGTKVDEDAYRLDKPSKPASKAASTSKAKTKKRAAAAPVSDAEEDEEDDKPAPKKRAKKADKPASSASAKSGSKKANGVAAALDDSKLKETEAKVAKANGKAPKIKALSIPVDEYCPLNTYTVYIDPSGTIYDASLNQTNAGNNNNKFYRIQILHSKGDYKCWTRWGRVGERGQNAILGNGSTDSAIANFIKKFKDKSGLAWTARAEMPKKGKYAYIERSYEDDSDNEDDSADDDEVKNDDDWVPPECTLDPPVESLMDFIFNAGYMQATMASLNYDANKLPLGKLSKPTILRGFQALKNLAELFDDNTLAQSEYGTTYPQAVADLSNQFYSLIPHAFGRNRPPIINTEAMLKRELELLESLTDMKDAVQIMKERPKEDMHPADKQFNGLLLDEMTALDHDSNEFKLLEAYLKDTKGDTHKVNYSVEEIFRIARKGENDRFQKSHFANIPSNRRLLWHGSRSTNFGGILSQGLRIAPPEAPSTGWMFDKGVYLADMSSKSVNYCCSYLSNNTALLLLCDAELGDPMQELTNASYNAATSAKAAGNYSTWGKGMTGPSKWKDAGVLHPSLEGAIMPDTSVKPGDTNVPGAYLQYNEYIAYDVTQVRLRYLFRVQV